MAGRTRLYTGGSNGGGGGGGTVTSVGLSMPSIMSVAGSPITTSGTFTVTLTAQSANRVFAGPATGAAAVPTFRSLVAADISSFAWVQGGNSFGATGIFGTLDNQSLQIYANNEIRGQYIVGANPQTQFYNSNSYVWQGGLNTYATASSVEFISIIGPAYNALTNAPVSFFQTLPGVLGYASGVVINEMVTHSLASQVIEMTGGSIARGIGLKVWAPQAGIGFTSISTQYSIYAAFGAIYAADGVVIGTNAAGNLNNPQLVLTNDGFRTVSPQSGAIEAVVDGLYYSVSNSLRYSILGIGDPASTGNIFFTDIDQSANTGDFNTVMGNGASNGLLIGSNNTLYGAGTGQSVFASYSDCTFIGASAGFAFATSSLDNCQYLICIGLASGIESGAPVLNSIAIGTYSYVNNDNECVIGGVATYQITRFVFGGTYDHVGQDNGNGGFIFTFPTRYNNISPNDLPAHAFVWEGPVGRGLTNAPIANTDGNFGFYTEIENGVSGSLINGVAHRFTIVGGTSTRNPMIIIGPDPTAPPYLSNLWICGNQAEDYVQVMLEATTPTTNARSGGIEFDGYRYWITTTSSDPDTGWRAAVTRVLFSSSEPQISASPGTIELLNSTANTIGNLTIPAGAMNSTSQQLRIRVSGRFETDSTPGNFKIDLSFDGNNLLGLSTNSTLPANQPNLSWEIDILIGRDSTGTTTNNWSGSGLFKWMVAGNAGALHAADASILVQNINWSIPNDILLTAKNVNGIDIEIYNAVVEIIM